MCYNIVTPFPDTESEASNGIDSLDALREHR